MNRFHPRLLGSENLAQDLKDSRWADSHIRAHTPKRFSWAGLLAFLVVVAAVTYLVALAVEAF